jgi:hypothetical protein
MAKSRKGESEFLTLPNWGQPAKGDKSDRKYWPSRIARGLEWGCQLHHGEKLSRELKKQQSAVLSYQEMADVYMNREDRLKPLKKAKDCRADDDDTFLPRKYLHDYPYFCFAVVNCI